MSSFEIQLLPVQVDLSEQQKSDIKEYNQLKSIDIIIILYIFFIIDRLI